MLFNVTDTIIMLQIKQSIKFETEKYKIKQINFFVLSVYFLCFKSEGLCLLFDLYGVTAAICSYISAVNHF